MLDGFDKVWNYEGTKRKVTYTNLDPGEYTFRVKASNNDGVWNEDGATLVIRILPPWWKTYWFRAGYVSLLFLSVAWVYNIRTKQVRTRNQKLKHKVLERSKELSDEKKRNEEIQRMNDALELEKQMLFELMEYFPDRITFKDTSSRITRVNTAKANRFNVRTDDFIGKTDFDFFTSEHAKLAFDVEQSVVKSGLPDLNREECLSYGDDRLWWSLTSRIPLKNHENEVIGILVITKDITPLKLAEKSLFERTQELERSKSEIEEQNRLLVSQQEELAAQNEELIQTQEEISAQRDLVAQQNDSLMEAQRIIELQNENLEQEVSDRTKELVEYNHQLEQFAFISAHNLRAPVARILGLGQILDLAKDNQKEKDEIFPKLIFTARELDEVVRDLNSILDLKRNSDSFITDVDLASEILMVRGNLEKEISSSQADIIVDFSKVGTIRTVKPYLDSVFYNLISNAIKYRHPDRTPVIRVSTEQRDGEVCLSVSDNGLGIDLSRFRDKVFNLYSRFHNHVEGKGMGLYLVKAQLTSMGGRVEIDSEEGKGTVFRAYFKV